jgi:hypothetical protein
VHRPGAVSEMTAAQHEGGPGRVWWSATAAVAMLLLLAASFSARVGIPIHDEAYLLNGIDRVLSGMVPVRDFQSYDPGRYYLLAPIRYLGGDRAIWTAGTAIIIAAALPLLVRLRQLSMPALFGPLLALPLLVAWSVPRHKAADLAAALVLIAVVIRVIDRPHRRSFLVAGVVLGVVTLVGRNHGLYGGVALAGAVVSLHRTGGVKATFARLAAVSGGALIGWSPMLATITFDEPMRRRFIEGIVRIFMHGTNIPLPVPWPGPDALSPTNWGFVVLPAVTIASLVCGWRHRRRDAPWPAVALSAGLIGLPYLHHMFSRADVTHMTQSSAGPLIGTFALLAALRERGTRPLLRIPVTAVVVVVVCWLTWAPLRVWPGFTALYTDEPVTWVEVHGEQRALSAASTRYVEHADQLAALVADDEVLFVAPRDIGVYLLLDRSPPSRTTYFTHRTSQADQRELIAELADVDWVAIRPSAYGGNPLTQFSRSHPLVMAFLRSTCIEHEPLAGFEVHDCRR